MHPARSLLTMALLAGFLPLLAVTLVWLLIGDPGLDTRGTLLGIGAGLGVHLAIVIGALLSGRMMSHRRGHGEASRESDDDALPPAPVERLARALAPERRDLRGAALKRFLLFAMPREPRRVPVMINDAIAVCIEAIRADVPRGGTAALTFDPAGDTGECSLDPDLFHQVLLNLILNARDAAGPSGHVAVRTQRLGDDVLVAVRDDGPGVPRSELGNLFRPFTSAKPRALGIGLATCRRIVMQHGGTISILNVLPHGLEVGVRLSGRTAGASRHPGRHRAA